MDLKPKKIEVTPIINSPIDIPNSIPKPVNVEVNSEERLDNCPTILGIDQLKEKLIQLGIRFDTDPKRYQKRDYWLLMCVLYRALIHLYETNPEDVIITDWLDEHSDKKVPSEKLVKETLDALISDIDGSIYAINTRLNEEVTNRVSGDEALQKDIEQINNLIPSEATSSNQLADKEFVHDQIATNTSNFRGDWSNWTSVPTDPQYYPEDYIGNKKPNNNDYLIIQNATDYSSEYTGIWRFVYKGSWDTLGKSGWEPQYRVEQAFTQEQLNAINSGITSQKVNNYDNYQQQIDNLLPLIYAGL